MRILCQVAIACVLLSGCGALVWAQSANATLSGVIRDPSGSSLPRATVTAIHTATGQSRQTTTGDTGEYTIPDLPIGDYSVRVEAPGFKSTLVPSLTLQVNQAGQLDLTLQIGAASEQVSVSEQLPLLVTQTSSVGQVVENKSIAGLALNGRQFWNLVALVPGASYTPGGQGTRTGGSSIRSSAVNVQINGTGFIYNGWLLDGTDITEYEQGGTNIQPNVDALAEFKVLSANMSAEYGRTPNIVSVITKSGTNEFHGTLLEFLRNDAVDARNFFAVSKNALKRNQFGGALGGPIKKNKIFFFTDLESTRQRQDIVFNNILPTDAMRTGNFAGQRTITDPTTGRPFPNNVIPTNRISPQASYFLPFMPTQRQGVFNAPQSLDFYKADMKVDTEVTKADRVMARYSIADNLESDPNQYPALGIQPLHSRAQNVALTWTRMVTPKLLNEARFGYYRDYFLFGAVLPGTNYVQQAGITGFEQTQLSPSFPLITLAGYSGFNGSGSNSLPKSNRIRTWQYSDTVSYSNGKHDIRFGGQLYHQNHGFFNGQSQEGQFAFSTNYTGNSFGDFLLGLPTSVFRAYPLSLYGNYANQWAAFVQDDYRVTPRLTLNLGLRWAYNPFFNGVNGQTSAFDYATGKVIVPTDGSGNLLNPIAQPVTPLLVPLFSDRTLGTSQLGLPQSIRTTGPGQWLPRFGFAWQPGLTNRVVIRGAYGIFDQFFDTNLSLQWAKAPPLTITQTMNNTTPAPTFTWADPFQGQPLVAANPNPGRPCAGSNLVLNTCVTPNVYAAPTQLQHTYIQQWNFAVQTQLQNNLSLNVAYVGNKTTHQQLISVPDNVPNPGAGAIQARRPYPQWSQLYMGETNGYGNYNALQVTLERRFAGGFQMLGSYSYSRCMDVGSNQNGPITVAFLHQNYGPCDYNMKHNLTVSSVYELPFGRGRQFMSNANRIIDGVLGGWGLAGILTARSGLPFTPVISGDTANTGVGNQRPVIVGSPSVSDPTPSAWFNVNAFAIPARYTYGNSGRNILLSDGLQQLDMTLRKNFRITESSNMEFRAEAFNLLNHPTFSAPNATIGSASAGIVTTTLNSNRILQFALKLTF
jgi:Carboxypeptidase regulatory-like domain/TonB dependent receptor